MIVFVRMNLLSRRNPKYHVFTKGASPIHQTLQLKTRQAASDSLPNRTFAQAYKLSRDSGAHR